MQDIPLDMTAVSTRSMDKLTEGAPRLLLQLLSHMQMLKAVALPGTWTFNLMTDNKVRRKMTTATTDDEARDCYVCETHRELRQLIILAIKCARQA